MTAPTILTPRPVPLGDITPYANNPRTITPEAVQAVAASIAAYGWQQPIITDAKGIVVIGHTRLLAAQHLHRSKASIPNWQDTGTAPVATADNLTKHQIKALRIADNKTGDIAQWDLTRLSIEIADLPDGAFTALSEKELAHLFLDADALSDINERLERKLKSDSPLTYYGGKKNLAPLICEIALNCGKEWRTWAEPFAGGAAAAFALPDDTHDHIVINDTNDNIVSFWRVLADAKKKDKLAQLIRDRELVAEAFFRQAQDTFKSEDATETERAWALTYLTATADSSKLLAGFSLNTNQIAEFKRKLEKVRECLPERMRKFIISSTDALKFIDRTRKTDMFYFVDPPYPGTNMGHYGGYTDADFAALCAKLAEFGEDIPFCMTTYHNDIIADAVERHGWHLIRAKVRSVVSTMAKRKKISPKADITAQREEWIITNFTPAPHIITPPPDAKPAAKKRKAKK